MRSLVLTTALINSGTKADATAHAYASRLGLTVRPRRPCFAKRVQVIDGKEPAAAVLDPDEEAFVVYVAPLTLKMSISPAGKPRSPCCSSKKSLPSPSKYSDFINVFLRGRATGASI